MESAPIRTTEPAISRCICASFAVASQPADWPTTIATTNGHHNTQSATAAFFVHATTHGIPTDDTQLNSGRPNCATSRDFLEQCSY